MVSGCPSVAYSVSLNILIFAAISRRCVVMCLNIGRLEYFPYFKSFLGPNVDPSE